VRPAIGRGGVLDSLDASAVGHWCSAALAALRRQQREIDALNVFPVADADTGTNLVLTFQAAAAALAPSIEPDSPPAGASSAEPGPGTGGKDAFARMARGALLGARGNSGMIVSQLLAGAAAALPAGRAVRGRALADALQAAVAASYAAVVDPVEGTVLSVARAAADGASAADSDDLATVSAATVKAAILALESTPAQLASIGLPGVVDAGGRGLVVILETLDAVVRGEPLRSDAPTPESHPTPAGVQRGWEIQYLLDVPGEAGPRVASLRRRLSEVGDSAVVARVDPHTEGHSLWTVHVHSDDIGATIEAALDAGRPHQIAVTPLIDTQPVPATGQAHVERRARAGRGVVAVVSGQGLARIFAAEGAITIDAPPTVEELLAAVDRTGAHEVVLLANDGAHGGVADAASLAAHRPEPVRQDGGEPVGRTVSVLHTRSPVQGMAALAVADPHRPFRDDVIAMAEAAAATRWAEVVIADQSAYTIAGPCRAGDVLSLVDGDVVAVGSTVAESARNLLDRLLNAGGELVTLVTGVGAAPTLADQLAEHLRLRWPFCECQVLDGGQRHAVLLVGVE
jgi:DAK2 domain fusion protein YloV